MHGIVFEWCEDWLGRYPSKPVIDPKGPKKGEMRVFRGGCWIYLPNFFRSAFRDGFFPETISYDVGFRVARDIY
jgi:formylglycine-generating enzyme required for sulfatase activity